MSTESWSMGTTREAICEPQSVGSDSSALSEFGHVGSLRRETRSRHEEGVATGPRLPARQLTWQGPHIWFTERGALVSTPDAIGPRARVDT